MAEPAEKEHASLTDQIAALDAAPEESLQDQISALEAKVASEAGTR